MTWPALWYPKLSCWPAMLASVSECLLVYPDALLAIHLLANGSEEARKWPWYLGIPPPMQKTWLGFRAPGFSLASPQLLKICGSEPVRSLYVSSSLSLCLSNKKELDVFLQSSILIIMCVMKLKYMFLKRDYEFVQKKKV